jgi:hypothetical protein
MRFIIAAACAALALAGCASSASNVAPLTASPYLYENLSCPQIAAEAQRVSARAAVLSGTQDSKATRDAVLTGVGLVVFWPALLVMPAVSGNDALTAELAKLKGEMIAIEQVCRWAALGYASSGFDLESRIQVW